MKKETEEQQALRKLANMCSKSEHCSGEIITKMQQWCLNEEAQSRILSKLTDGKYIDDERFCRFFVNDKIKYNKWGRRKIEQALWQKRMDTDISNKILDEIDDSEYLSVLRPMLKSKEKNINAHNDYERKMKLIKYALGRGFTMDIIRQCIEGADDEE